MRLICFFTIVLLCQSYLFAQQTDRQVVLINIPRETADFYTSGELPFVDQLPFFSYFVEWPAGALPLKIRFAREEGQWEDWQALKRDEHNLDKGITELKIGVAEHRFYELQIDTRFVQTPSVKLHFFHPDETIAIPSSEEANNTFNALICPCPQPEIQVRDQWCPGGGCPSQGTPAFTEVTHLIVHHSAGTNAATDWAAIVRAIWDFHVNGNGWDDIGYNYLVDPNGLLYEGRGNDIRGAHFCGTNTGTMGVCVLGNFTNIAPTTEAINTLEQLLAWKACDIGAHPLEQSFHASSGLNLMHISGHRDGCSTSCPGDSFYPLFSALRGAVDDLIINECSTVNTVGPTLPTTALTISPNPVNNVLNLQLNIEHTGPMYIQILDINQRVILTRTSIKHTTLWQDELDVQALRSGTYLLRLHLGDQEGIWRFVKQ